MARTAESLQSRGTTGLNMNKSCMRRKQVLTSESPYWGPSGQSPLSLQLLGTQRTAKVSSIPTTTITWNNILNLFLKTWENERGCFLRILRCWQDFLELNGTLERSPKLSCVTKHCILSVSFHSQPAKPPLSRRRCMCPFHPSHCSLLHTLLAPAPLPPLFLSLPFPRGPGKLCRATSPHAQGCLEVVKAIWSRAPVISPSVCTHTTWMGMIF